ncbi:MAG: hypothetical protein ACSHXD_01165 [Marinosulfonomonas sp.]
MPDLTIHQAKDIARNWCVTQASLTPGVVGALLTGSVAWKPDSAPYPTGSDIDIIVIVDAATLQNALGKFLYQGLTLEVTYAKHSELAEIDTVLADYHRAGLFRQTTALWDPAGQLHRLMIQAAPHFANTKYVQRRMQHARQNALNFLTRYENATTLHDQVTSLFFAAGVTAHIVLTAALQNPTIRRRYISSGQVLTEAGLSDLHEHMLGTLGSRDLDAATTQAHLDRLGRQFDTASRRLSSPHPFAADMKQTARPIAIDGTQAMIDQNHHREAAFWIIAVYARCRAVMVADGTASDLADFDTDMWLALNAFGLSNRDDMQQRARAIRTDIDQVFDICQDQLIPQDH